MRPFWLFGNIEQEITMSNIDCRFAGVGALALLLAACTGMSYAPVKYSGGLMTGANGMTLYTFDKDAPGSGKSVCNAQCATNWPPFMATSSDRTGGDWSVVTRDDGTKQWAWSGQPLYYYAKDQKSGDVTGDNFNKVWHAVQKPATDYSAGNFNGP
jgi:predicted lipoprotein with Yx(FWY)xxD motif